MNYSDQIVGIAADMFNVHPRDLVGPYKYQFLMRPRFALAKALRDNGWTYPAIGNLMNCDHTTAIYRVRQADVFMERSPAYRAKVKNLTERLSDDRR